MDLKLFVLLGILLLASASADDETSVSQEEDSKSNEPSYVHVEEELSEEMKKEVKIEYLNKVDDCKKQAKAQDFLSLNFTSKWADSGETILSTWVILTQNFWVFQNLESKYRGQKRNYEWVGVCVLRLLPSTAHCFRPLGRSALEAAGDAAGDAVGDVAGKCSGRCNRSGASSEENKYRYKIVIIALRYGEPLLSPAILLFFMNSSDFSQFR